MLYGIWMVIMTHTQKSIMPNTIMSFSQRLLGTTFLRQVQAQKTRALQFELQYTCETCINIARKLFV